MSPEAATGALVTVSRASVELTRVADRILRRGTIDNRDVQVLLAVHAASAITSGDLAAGTGSSPPEISRALARLELAGLVRRRADTTDRRRVLVSTTPLGAERIAEFEGGLVACLASLLPGIRAAFAPLGVGSASTARRDVLGAAAEMARAGAEFVAEATTLLAPFGVQRFSERFALAILATRSDVRPAALARELGLTPTGTSALIDRLERAGLVHRQTGLVPGDRRAVCIAATAHGDEAARILVAVFGRHAASLAGAFGLLRDTSSLDPGFDT